MASEPISSKCGCGREGRYTRAGEDGLNIWACNKYQRCPTYEELTERTKSLQISELRYKTALQKIVGVNGMDYEYKAWAKEALDATHTTKESSQ